MKVNIYQLILLLIMIFIPVNLLKNLFEFPIMLIVGGCILLLMFMLLLSNLNKSVLISMSIPIVLFIITSFVTQDMERHFRYFLNWYSMLCVVLICSNELLMSRFIKVYKEKEKILNFFMWISYGVICVLLLTPQAYSSGGWGLTGSFSAFTVSHAVAASVCSLTCFLLLYSIRKTKTVYTLILFLLSLFAVFQTGARIYVISIGILLFFYVFDILKNGNVKIMFLFCSLVFIGLIFTTSSFAEKMTVVLSYQDSHDLEFLDALTSGRTTIWEIDITNFLKSSIPIILFGGGFDYSYKINSLYYKMDIFSHNVFLETLLSFGIVGLTLIVINFRNMFKKNHYELHGFIIMLVYSVAIGFMNGLFDSQIYCFSILIVNMVITIMNDDKKSDLSSNIKID